MIESRIIVSLANSVWQSCLLALFTAMSLRLLGRTSANRRYVLWMVTLVVCALLPALDYRLAGLGARKAAHEVSPALSVRANVVVPPKPSKPVADGSIHNDQLLAVSTDSSAAQGRMGRSVAWLRPLKSQLDLWAARLGDVTYQSRGVLLLLWIGIANLLIARLVIQLVALIRAKQRVDILQEYEWIGQRPGLRRRYSVGVSDSVDVPCLLGLSRPLIAIPRTIAGALTDSDVRRIVQHESAHVRRYDDWFNLLEQVLLALLFFNPVLYYLTGVIRLEREIACDDQVAVGERLFYAECLSNLASHTRGRSASVVPTFFKGRQELLVRIEQLLDRQHISSARLGAVPYLLASLIIALALLSARTGIPVLAAPPAASPSPPAQPAASPALASPAPSPAARASSSTIRIIEVRSTVTRTSPKSGSSGNTPPTQKVIKKIYIIHGADCQMTFPSSPCGHASHAGGNPQGERVVDIVISCPRGSFHLHALPPSNAQRKAMQAAGCPGAIDLETLDVQPIPSMDMKMMQMNLQKSMSALQRSMNQMSTPDHMMPHLNSMIQALAGQQHAMALMSMPKLPQWVVSAPMLEAQALGVMDTSLPALPVKEITDMRDHGVTASYIASLSHAGYADLPAADYIRLHDHHVTAEAVESLRRTHPGETLTVDDLIRLQSTH